MAHDLPHLPLVGCPMTVTITINININLPGAPSPGKASAEGPFPLGTDADPEHPDAVPAAAPGPTLSPSAAALDARAAGQPEDGAGSSLRSAVPGAILSRPQTPFDEGRRDRQLEVLLYDNAYAPVTQPEQYGEWREGWKAEDAVMREQREGGNDR